MTVSLRDADLIRLFYPASEGLHILMEPRPRCGRPTATGTICRARRMKEPHWPRVCVEYAAYVPPSCAAHATSGERSEHDRVCALTAERAERNRLAYIGSHPVECHGWPVTDEHRERSRAAAECADPEESRRLAMRLLAEWQADRCAICGAETDCLDHDHRTGMIRGYLCQGCNTAEGMGHAEPESVFTRYRDRNPANILGIHLRYYSPWTGWAEPAPPPPPIDAHPAFVLATRYGMRRD